MYNLTFDHTKTDHLEISHEQIKAAFDTLDEKTKQALQQSYERIKAVSYTHLTLPTKA